MFNQDVQIGVGFPELALHAINSMVVFGIGGRIGIRRDGFVLVH